MDFMDSGPIRRSIATAISIDPKIDAPVIQARRAAPRERLAAASPLAALILDNSIWVRTQDGTLYLASKHHYFGLNWGYSGSGPRALAVLAHRMLSRHQLRNRRRHQWRP
jgi:hypothetical protein